MVTVATPYPSATRDARRARVAQERAADPTVSARALAHLLGVSKDTVRADLRHLAAHGSGGEVATQPPAAAPAPAGEPVDLATSPPRHLPGESGGVASQPPGEVAMPGDVLPVAVSADLAEDLAVLAEAGLTPGEAIAMAVRHVANAVLCAWDFQDWPRGELPHFTNCGYLSPEAAAALPRRAPRTA